MTHDLHQALRAGADLVVFLVLAVTVLSGLLGIPSRRPTTTEPADLDEFIADGRARLLAAVEAGEEQ